MEESTAYLLENCRRGNKPAQMALYNKYARKLYLVSLRITGNRMEAEEAMQDAFLKIFNRLNLFRDEHNFEAWIHRIAVHTAIDYVRRHTNEEEEMPCRYAETDLAESGDESTEDRIQYTVQQIKEATQQLPPGYRIVLSLYLFEGYDMEEIASILNIQPASVRTQYLRAKRKLLNIIAVKGYG
ncbi:MAG: sigma-70 family RNA polymerase sigma factor [Tannerellaceae bacterium]|jgi:RNA polymerase sigma-70 factor (ECF subfamily)|nr:sigma-70 family RNA polymerase sigma factor [Tannerellaceae bacterium]